MPEASAVTTWDVPWLMGFVGVRDVVMDDECGEGGLLFEGLEAGGIVG